jgi:hypothetical protein
MPRVRSRVLAGPLETGLQKRIGHVEALQTEVASGIVSVNERHMPDDRNGSRQSQTSSAPSDLPGS